MTDQGHQIMVSLQVAADELAQSAQWGTSRQDMALKAVLEGAQGAVAMFDSLAGEVAALEARVAALENPPPPPPPEPTP